MSSSSESESKLAAATAEAKAPTHYEVLGVSRNASDSDIKRAYRRLSLQLHPDKQTSGSSAPSEYHRVTAAYEVLRDADRRRWYDLYGRQLSEQISQSANELANAGTASVRRDEAKLVSLMALSVIACVALVAVRTLVLPAAAFPLEWIVYTALAHFLLRRPLDVRVGVLPALASFLVVSTAQLPVVTTVAWWIYAGLVAGAASGLVDQSLLVALGAALGMSLLGVGQLPAAWTVTGVLFDLYGRVILGASLVSAAAVWLTEIEPRAAWHRDDARSSALSLVTSLGVGGVPAGLPIAAFVWMVLWRVDGWLGVRVEYFAAALLLTVLSFHSAVAQPRAPRSYRVAALAALAVVALVYYYGDEAAGLPLRFAVQVVSAAMLHFLEVAVVFGVGEPPAGVGGEIPTAVVAPARSRAIVGVWFAHVLASLFLHPVSLSTGPWQLGAMLLVLCGLVPLGIQPLPQLIKCAFYNEPLTFYNDAVDEDDDAAAAAAAGDDGPLEGEDDAAYRLRRLVKSSSAAAGAGAADEGPRADAALEFYDTLQMARAEMLFKERVRLNDAFAAAVDDDSFEVSFESWSTARKQVSSARPPKSVAQPASGATQSAADLPVDSAAAAAAPADAQDGDEECFVCHRAVANGLKRCGACFAGLYCSLECQKRDWSGHKEACKQLTHIYKLEQRWHNDRAGLMRDALAAQAEREKEMRARAAAQQQAQQLEPEEPQVFHNGHTHGHGDAPHFH